MEVGPWQHYQTYESTAIMASRSSNARNLHTSLAALKFRFNDHIVFDADFDKRLNLNEVKGVYECRMAIQAIADENLSLISRSMDESDTSELWVCFY